MKTHNSKNFYMFSILQGRRRGAGCETETGLPRLLRVDTFREAGTSYRQEWMRELGWLREARRSLVVMPDQTINVVDIRDR